jgi:hypothetical protein
LHIMLFNALWDLVCRDLQYSSSSNSSNDCCVTPSAAALVAVGAAVHLQVTWSCMGHVTRITHQVTKRVVEVRSSRHLCLQLASTCGGARAQHTKSATATDEALHNTLFHAEQPRPWGLSKACIYRLQKPCWLVGSQHVTMTHRRHAPPQ